MYSFSVLAVLRQGIGLSPYANMNVREDLARIKNMTQSNAELHLLSALRSL